jgi:hypothetical protein
MCLAECINANIAARDPTLIVTHVIGGVYLCQVLSSNIVSIVIIIINVFRSGCKGF